MPGSCRWRPRASGRERPVLLGPAASGQELPVAKSVKNSLCGRSVGPTGNGFCSPTPLGGRSRLFGATRPFRASGQKLSSEYCETFLIWFGRSDCALNILMEIFVQYLLAVMKKTYQGSCHCGKVKFEVDTDLDHVRVCDCSMCRRRGALNHRVDEADLRPLTPLQDLTVYVWNTRTAKDYFCPVCGILPFRRPRTAPNKWAVNVRCLEGVDLSEIPTKSVRGSKLDVIHDGNGRD